MQGGNGERRVKRLLQQLWLPFFMRRGAQMKLLLMQREPYSIIIGKSSGQDFYSSNKYRTGEHLC